MIYRLIFLTGSLQGQRITVEQSPMVLGRAPDCTVVLADDEVALKHATLEHKAEGLHIRDMGSMNKILVNGRELHERWLKHGDEIELGRTRFLVQALVQAEVSVGDEQGRRRRRHRQRWVLGYAAALVLVSLIYWRRHGKQGDETAAEEEPAAAEAMAATNEPIEGPVALVMPTQPVEAATSSVAPPPTDLAPVSEELRHLRQDLLDIRETVKDLASKQAATSNVPLGGSAGAGSTTAVIAAAAPAGAGESARGTPAAESAGEKAARLLEEARRQAGQGQLAEADRTLQAVQKIAPDSLPAYEERAALFERRGMPDRAMEQWLEIVDRGATGTLYEKATAEYLRLDQMQPKNAALTQRIRITSLEQNKFQESDEFAEERVVNVGLTPQGAEKAFDAGAVSVAVSFFDRDPKTGAVEPTRAIVPRAALQLAGPWGPGDEKRLSATYVITREARESDVKAGRLEQYYGYVVRVYYRGELQDEEARPRVLLRSAPPAGGT